MSSDKNEESSIRSVGDFAKFLGLSRWTVSRILNGHPGVHEDTRKRVMDEMHRIGFQPNMMARSLKGAKTGLVGVCFQEIESPLLARKISYLQESLRRKGLRAIMEITSGVVEAERDIISHFSSLRVDGVILVGSELPSDDPIFERLSGKSIPLVAIDPVYDIPLPRVELDRHQAMHLTLRHLHQRGHSRFAVLGLESDPVYGARRMDGLRQAAEKLGFDWERSFVSLSNEECGNWSYQYGYDLAQELLQSEDAPRAVLAMNDRVGIGAMKAIREWGFAVPKDFAVVGFDNLEIGQWSEPALTTVGQNVNDLIDKAVEAIQGMIEKEGVLSKDSVTIVQPKLIIRASS